MDKQIYLPIMTGLLFGAFGALVFSPSAYSVWGFALATFAWAIATGMCRQAQDNDYEIYKADHERMFKEHEDMLKTHALANEAVMDLRKQLDSVRTAINMKQLGR